MIKARHMTRQVWDKSPKIEFKNVARDFGVIAVILSITPSQNIKVAWQFSSGPEKIGYEVKIAKRQGRTNTWYVREPGSAFNAYVYNGPLPKLRKKV